MTLLKQGETSLVTNDETGTIASNINWINPANWSVNSISAVSVNGSLFNTNDDFFFPSRYNQIPFKTAFPAFDQVQLMCDQYPGLERAYENFRTAYVLVEQDWKGKQDAR